MAFYRLTDRFFSRRWRRNKDYTEKQIKLLARHIGAKFEKQGDCVRVVQGDKVVANFREVAQTQGIHENLAGNSIYAALRNPYRGRVIYHTVRSAVSIATVAGESRRGGNNG